MSIERALIIFIGACIVMIILLAGFVMVQEACDVNFGDGWPCGISDDGFHDGKFDWDRVFPW